MVKKLSKAPRPKARAATKRRRKPAVLDKQEQILRAATIHLIRKVGGLLVATGLREEKDNGDQRWIITVTLRYPTGFEGYIGDLLYDGKDFTMLTEESVMNERAEHIDAHPEGIRLWNEYRAATLRTGKA
jgi:hypothetical protein